MATYLDARNVLNVEVSCFKNYDTPANPKSIKMYSWLTNAKYLANVLAIRAETEKAKRDTIKATLPAITPSGEFTYRRATDLVKHSGLLQFDIDWKDNPRIRNYADLKGQIANLPFVAYCGLSVSGTGYWGLVPIAYPERHGQHFDALKRVFARYGISLDDKPRNVASLRGYSYDPDAYFAQQVMVFELYDEPKPRPTKSYIYRAPTSSDKQIVLNRIFAPLKNACPGNFQTPLYNAALVAGGFVAGREIAEDEIVATLEEYARQLPRPFGESKRAITGGIRDGFKDPINLNQRTAPLNIDSKTRSQPTGRTGKTPEQPASQPTPVQVKPKATTELIDVQPLVRPINESAYPKQTQYEVKIPALIQHYWTLFAQPPLPWSKITTYKALLRFRGFEVLVVGPDEDYPEEWDEPILPGTQPTIQAISLADYLNQPL